MRPRLHVSAFVMLVLIGWTVLPAPVGAAALAGSHPPAAPSAGVVGNGLPGSCNESTLNTALAGGGTVTFNCGGAATISLLNMKVISIDTTIIGGDVIVLDGQFFTRLFKVNSGATLRLQHIVLNRGYGNDGNGGGAISSDGALYLENTTIQNSLADSNHQGGAIASTGPVTITNSLLTGNSGGSGGALYADTAHAIINISNSVLSNNHAINIDTGYGGAIWLDSEAHLTVTNSELGTNTARQGGAVYLSSNTVASITASATSIHDNSATSGGGGIYNNQGRLTVTGVNISYNSTDSDHSGGAIYSTGPVTITNGTLKNNDSGSILSANSASAIITISHSTFSNNHGSGIAMGGQTQLTLSDSGVMSNTGAGITSEGVLTITNVTISNNHGGIAMGGQSQLTLSDSGVMSNTGGGITSEGVLTITNVTISNNISGSGSGSYGGGILNAGTLSLVNSTIFSNTADTGAGIENTGIMTLTNVTLSANWAHCCGGGIHNDGTATLTNATLSGNSADYGGGIENGDTGYLGNGSGTLTATDVTFSNNKAFLQGGAIFNHGMAALTNATLSGNSDISRVSGGGVIYNDYGTTSLTNATLSGNSAQDAGIIVNHDTLTLTNSTFSGNKTHFSSIIANYGTATLASVTISSTSGFGLYQSSVVESRRVTLQNTIIAAGYLGFSCAQDPASVGTIVSQGYNLSSDAGCSTFFNQASDLNNTNPNLGPLANNGGPTLTHMPQAPSAAIDAIPNGANGCGTTLTTDQRGIARPANGKCDIGAVESPGPEANLSTSQHDAPDPASMGRPVSYSVVVTNTGPVTATGVILTDTLPVGTSLQSVAASQGSCTSAATVTCNLGSLANGAHLTVTVTVTPTAAGMMTNTVMVTANEFDPVLANNSASERTMVVRELYLPLVTRGS